MTAPLLFRRRRAAAPRRVIVDVTNRWRLDGPGPRREVLVRTPVGLESVLLADDHPALVRFLTRAAAAAA